jgi:hypothetical protein
MDETERGQVMTTVRCRNIVGRDLCSLTTEHAASSYGIPVLLLSNGDTAGPAEAPVIEVAEIVRTDEGRKVIAAARSAGFIIAHRPTREGGTHGR